MGKLPARVGIGDDRHAGGERVVLQVGRPEHGGGARFDRLADEGAPVLLRALQGSKKEAGTDAPAISAQAGDLSILTGFRGTLFVAAQQLKKTQACDPRLSP